MAKTYFVMFDPRYGRAVPDALARGNVEAHLAEWRSEPNHQFRTDIIGTAYMLAAYVTCIADAQNVNTDVKFIDPNNQPMDMADITEIIGLSPLEMLDR